MLQTKHTHVGHTNNPSSFEFKPDCWSRTSVQRYNSRPGPLGYPVVTPARPFSFTPTQQAVAGTVSKFRTLTVPIDLPVVV